MTNEQINAKYDVIAALERMKQEINNIESLLESSLNDDSETASNYFVNKADNSQFTLDAALNEYKAKVAKARFLMED